MPEQFAAKTKHRPAKAILWSRLLTHSGDQAWDFAVPLALISIFPMNLNVVALYFLVVRFGHVIFVTKLCAKMDNWHRMSAIKVGISMQTLGVILGAAAIFMFSTLNIQEIQWDNSICLGLFTAVVMAGLVSSLGATMMDIAVSQDWMPIVIDKADLHAVNSRLKQIDLGTELGSPILAGAIMTFAPMDMPLAGFAIIALWNIISFYPEYRLLAHVFRAEEQLAKKVLPLSPVSKASLIEKMAGGWRNFMAQRAAPAMLAYSFLWLSVLSPHGVLLTAWMKAEWELSELVIGTFRGLGAVFGLFATVLFPKILARVPLLRASRWLITGEAFCLLAAGFSFYLGQNYAVVFLAFILLSRIGLYGFSLGEMEIRQITIPTSEKGKVNGFASALTSLATLGVYGAGSLLPHTNDFHILVYGSVVFVVVGTLIFGSWSIYQEEIPDARRAGDDR